MKQLISIDLKAEFGFFRKPETNDGINLSYNMLHKPALLGILGAIIGLEGYTENGVQPEYYTRLAHVPAGIEPLRHDQGNFAKTVIKYSNTVGYANKGANYLTEEATLIAPAYRCYLLLDSNDDLERKLLEYLEACRAEYLPYFGKNEFAASWWEGDGSSFKNHAYEARQPKENSYRIKTLFQKSTNQALQKNVKSEFDFWGNSENGDGYFYFERLPVGFHDVLKQYTLGSFVYSTYRLNPEVDVPNLYYLKDEDAYVQLT